MAKKATFLTARPLHVAAPVAKVDGDTQIMAQDYQQRRANFISTLSHDSWPWVFSYRLDHHLGIHEDCAFLYATKESLARGLREKMAMDGTHSFAVSLAGASVPLSYVLED